MQTRSWKRAFKHTILASTIGLTVSLAQAADTIKVGVLHSLSGTMAIVLVEQYLDFALDLCDRLCVLDRGRVKLAGQAQEVDQAAVRGLVTV